MQRESFETVLEDYLNQIDWEEIGAFF